MSFTLEELEAFMMGPSEISFPTNQPSLATIYEEPSFADSFGDEDEDEEDEGDDDDDEDEDDGDYEEPSFGDSFGDADDDEDGDGDYEEPSFGDSFGDADDEEDDDEPSFADSFGDADTKTSDFGDSRKRSSVAIGPLNAKKPRGLFSPPASFAVAAQPVVAPCEICGDEVVLHRCTLLACQHMFCKPCLSHWITTQVEQRQRRISCPAVGCGHSLNQEDIARLSIDPAVPAAYSALMAETYEDRLAEMSSDPALKAWMDANARPCPKCSLLITRTSGCNTVRCPCGHRFCYCCGQERCVKMPPPVAASASAFHALLAQQAELWREAEKQGRKINPFTGQIE